MSEHEDDEAFVRLPKDLQKMVLEDAHLHPASAELDDVEQLSERPLHIPVGAGVPFLELLLLAIIDGREETLEEKERASASERIRRLNTAMEAIACRPSIFANDLDTLEERALEEMVRLDLKTRREINSRNSGKKNSRVGDPPKPRSVRSLATEAYAKFYRTHENEELDTQHRRAKVNRLAELYKGTYQKRAKKLKDSPDGYRRYLAQGLEDDVARQLQFTDLERIMRILEDHKIPFSLDEL